MFSPRNVSRSRFALVFFSLWPTYFSLIAWWSGAKFLPTDRHTQAGIISWPLGSVS